MEIKDLMKDEKEAIEGYNLFIMEHYRVITKQQVRTIHRIIKDEERHWKMLNKMKLKEDKD